MSSLKYSSRRYLITKKENLRMQQNKIKEFIEIIWVFL